MKKFRDLLILIVAFAAVWAVVTWLPVFDREDVEILPVDKEEKLGKYLSDELIKAPGYKQLNDTTVDNAIDKITSRLSKQLINSKYTYHIIVVDNDILNAFALPGGYILLTRGIIEFFESPEELSAVIAHEMGHIENKHLIKGLIADIGISVLTEGDRFALSEVGKIVTYSKFNREQEKEADKFSFDLMVKSGMNPRIIASFFRRLNEEGRDYNKNLEMIASHPHNDARIRAALEYKLPDNFIPEKLDIDWKEVENSINDHQSKR